MTSVVLTQDKQHIGRVIDEVQGPQTSVMVNPRVLKYETLIVVSQLKLHQTATITMALKNITMSYPAADYYGPRAPK